MEVRTVLLTGGSSGIGAATARLLALCNWLRDVFQELAEVKCDFCGGC